MIRVSVMWLVVLGWSVVACGGDASGVDTIPSQTSVPSTRSSSEITIDREDAITTTTAREVPVPSGDDSEIPRGEEAMRAVAVSDLADRLDVAASEIEVVSIEAVTWRDSSIGCPVEGMSYQQVLTEGSRIVLSVQGRTYDYHASPARAPFYCANPQTPAEGGGLSDS